MGDPFGLNDLRVVQEQGGPGVVAEKPDASTEDDRDEVDAHLVDQAGRQSLSPTLPGLTETSLPPANALACATALGTPSVTKVKGASGWFQSAGASWVTTNSASATGIPGSER